METEMDIKGIIVQQSAPQHNNHNMHLLAKYEQLLLICIITVPLFKI